jgi:hypothetical protein
MAGSKSPPTTHPFLVESYDNFHVGDGRGEWTNHGSFETVEAAVKCARGVIDDWIKETHQPGMTAEDLKSRFHTYGHVAVVRGAPGAFDAYKYLDDRLRDFGAKGV